MKEKKLETKIHPVEWPGDQVRYWNDISPHEMIANLATKKVAAEKEVESLQRQLAEKEADLVAERAKVTALMGTLAEERSRVGAAIFRLESGLPLYREES